MIVKPNQWASRFEKLLIKEHLANLLQINIPPINIDEVLTTESLIFRFRVASQRSFYPSLQCVEIAHRIIMIMHEHCTTSYKSEREFLSNIYLDKPASIEYKPIIISGLAGVGKSSLLKRISDLFNGEQTVLVDSLHPEFHLSPPTLISIDDKNTLQQISEKIAGTKNNSAAKKKLYLRGVPGIFVDEMQFLTTSDTANVRASKLILGLGFLGIPYVVCANFSLLHKLLKRPDEEKQRILSDVIVMDVDGPDSDCWKNTIRQIIDLIPTKIKLDVGKEANRLYQMTAGRKRALVVLLEESLRSVKLETVISMDVIEKVFQSSRFAIFKKDSELIANQSLLKKPIQGRMDLWCPKEFQSASGLTSDAVHEFENTKKIANLELLSAMSQKERQAIKQIEKLNQGKKSTSGKIIKMPLTKSQENLLENVSKFLDEL